MKAETLDKQFDEGADITASLDLSKAKRVLLEQKRVNVDFPTWMIDSLDREAGKLGVTRQSIIKVCVDKSSFPIIINYLYCFTIFIGANLGQFERVFSCPARCAPALWGTPNLSSGHRLSRASSSHCAPSGWR